MSAAQIIAKTISDIGYRYSPYQVFSDFVEIAAISIHQTLGYDEVLEKRYFEITRQYDQGTFDKFPELLGQLMLEMLEAGKDQGPVDILGKAFELLDLGNKRNGQYFTPVQVCDAMAQMALHDYHELIDTQGYITVAEPCCGSGRMIYALCRAFKQAGYDYTKQMVIHATDIDQRSVHMTYIQMALYGIPGIVVHGNSLIGEEYHRWYTPAYVQDNWYKEVA